MCHNPVIGDHVLKPEVPWSCRLCDHLQANSKETNNNKKVDLSAVLTCIGLYSLYSLYWTILTFFT